MSLNNIQLNSQLLTTLYPSVLIETSKEISSSPTTKEHLKYLGNNNKNILVLVQNESVAFLEDAELSFLSNILSACKLSLADVAVVNLHNTKESSYQHLTEELKSKSILLFGVEAEAIDLPFKFPHFQLQQFGNHAYLAAPALRDIEEDKTLKTKLWNCLKNLFGL